MTSSTYMETKDEKRRGSDLKEGKVSNLVIEHLHLVPTDRTRLITLLQQDRNSTPQLGSESIYL